MTDLNLSSNSKLTETQLQMLKQWAIVNILGFTLFNGMWSAIQNNEILKSASQTQEIGSLFRFIPFLFVVTTGLGATAFLQHLILSKHYPISLGQWGTSFLSAAILGVMLYLFIFESLFTVVNIPKLLEIFLDGLYAGLCLGIVQYLYLQEIFFQAYWWIVANSLTFAITTTLSHLLKISSVFLDSLQIGIIYTAITGFTLIHLMKPHEPQNSSVSSSD